MESSRVAYFMRCRMVIIAAAAQLGASGVKLERNKSFDSPLR